MILHKNLKMIFMMHMWRIQWFFSCFRYSLLKRSHIIKCTTVTCSSEDKIIIYLVWFDVWTFMLNMCLFVIAVDIIRINFVPHYLQINLTEGSFSSVKASNTWTQNRLYSLCVSQMTLDSYILQSNTFLSDSWNSWEQLRVYLSCASHRSHRSPMPHLEKFLLFT